MSERETLLELLREVVREEINPLREEISRLPSEARVLEIVQGEVGALRDDVAAAFDRVEKMLDDRLNREQTFGLIQGLDQRVKVLEKHSNTIAPTS